MLWWLNVMVIIVQNLALFFFYIEYFQDFKSCRYRFSVVVEELREAKASEYRWDLIP